MREVRVAVVGRQEQQAIRQLAYDLPTLWQAPTTTATDRKRLLRLVIREITLTVDPNSRSAEFVIWWSGEVTTRHTVTCPPLGWHCVTDEPILQRIRDLAPTHPDHHIAEMLNAEGITTQTGKAWTYDRVQAMRKQHHIPTGCPIDTQQQTARGDGLVHVKTAAKLLNVSSSLINLWATQGILYSDQRVNLSKRWVRVDDQDLTRLNGSLPCDHLPTIADLMEQQQLTRDEVWALVREGHYLAYRVKLGKNWQWRLEAAQPPEKTAVA